MGFATDCIHAGQEPEPVTGAVTYPIFQTSTYVQPRLGEHKGYEYARTKNPTRSVLEANLAALERGKYGHCFASGMSAIDVVFRTLKSGDHVVAGENMYGRKRVTTQREEIIMDTDPFDLEDFGPEFRQHLLEVRLRRDEGLRPDDKVRESQLCRQTDTLHFARWALWELINDVHLARDLEVGEAADGKLANV